VRKIVNINRGWAFSKQAASLPCSVPENWQKVDLPHSWNAIDGQDGGGDYYRGTCYYARTLTKSQLPQTDRYYLQIKGANASADVYLNGKHLAHHDGGYSTWRVELTQELKEDTLLVISVDNGENDRVYPQMADFTFYGGLYRDVDLICVSEAHFDLDCYGGPGLMITPEIVGEDARVDVEVFLTAAQPEYKIRYTLCDMEGKLIAQQETTQRKVSLEISQVRLWHGRKDPWLYRLTAELLEGERVLDQVASQFGCRSFSVDPDRGFILNGEEYPLRGVSRHQDRLGIGNALLPVHHKEDLELICEMGANTVRLAHYQHDQYFYDLCDRMGMVVWAEIPYISKHMPAARENTISQMKELIYQNYNHPSIVVWGLSNEITMSGSDENLLENHRILNDLCHKLDPKRLTAIACVSMCKMEDPYIQIPDVVSYNHYFGWYGGDTSMNGPWFDQFHEKFPSIPIGCSEYGCEALNWHTSDPVQGDYTEEYQAYYHEELIKQLFPRKYLWATHVWNMFDFGADARSEGGENGQNHKGLVTFDRKYKKDSFYAYKAWLSEEPFVHICGKRYVDRVENTTRVTVYSNQPEVELYVNGAFLASQTAPEHFFYFDVPNHGQTILEAVAGACRDKSTIRKVDTFNEAYRLKETGAILNWFDITQVPGRFSLNDKVGDILATVQGKLVLAGIAKKLMGGKKKGERPKAMGFEITSDMLQMLNGFTVLRLTNLAGTAGLKLSKEELLELNRKLNKIKKR